VLRIKVVSDTIFIHQLDEFVELALEVLYFMVRKLNQTRLVFKRDQFMASVSNGVGSIDGVASVEPNHVVPKLGYAVKNLQDSNALGESIPILKI
jgi:hypothetical protein